MTDEYIKSIEKEVNEWFKLHKDDRCKDIIRGDNISINRNETIYFSIRLPNHTTNNSDTMQSGEMIITIIDNGFNISFYDLTENKTNHLNHLIKFEKKFINITITELLDNILTCHKDNINNSYFYNKNLYSSIVIFKYHKWFDLNKETIISKKTNIEYTNQKCNQSQFNIGLQIGKNYKEIIIKYIFNKDEYDIHYGFKYSVDYELIESLYQNDIYIELFFTLLKNIDMSVKTLLDNIVIIHKLYLENNINAKEIKTDIEDKNKLKFNDDVDYSKDIKLTTKLCNMTEAILNSNNTNVKDVYIETFNILVRKLSKKDKKNKKINNNILSVQTTNINKEDYKNVFNKNIGMYINNNSNNELDDYYNLITNILIPFSNEKNLSKHGNAYYHTYCNNVLSGLNNYKIKEMLFDIFDI